MISVIVPAYNEADYLPRVLGSLSRSALFLSDVLPSVGAEIIVVDNASADETATVAQSYGARVLSEPQRGIARARNAGGRAARGSVLVFVDADYRVPREFLSALWSRFSSDSALSAAGVKVRVEPSELSPLARRVADLVLWGARRVKRMAFGIFAIRRDYFELLGGFDELLFAYEDVDLLERIAKDARAGRAHYKIFESLAVYTSARGIRRGGMLSAYSQIAISSAARRDMSRCGYWYDR